MKKIYWRPRAVSRPALLLIAIISLAGLLIVERWKVPQEQPYFQEKVKAANLASEAFQAVRAERVKLGPPIDPINDPAETGLIGLPMSPVTSVLGDIAAKQTSANPNFAAVLVEFLKEADVKEGDVVAVGVSGSFPSLNICTYAALESLGVKPLVISSASASQWGANVPQLMWPDMEHLLRVQKRIGENGEELPPLFKTRSIACSIGGNDDQGAGLTEEGLKLVESSIERNGLKRLRVELPESMNNLPPIERAMEEFRANIDQRMNVYRDNAKGQPIAAYINVGGGTVSVGKNLGKTMFLPGLNERPPRHVRQIDGVMARFINEGVPVIHMVHINAIANRFTLPLEPIAAPPVGEGGVFVGIDYSRPLVIGVLAFILMCLYGFIRTDIGFRILRTSKGASKRELHPEPMV
jgi:poly-gamma-glutamate system protein